MSLSLYNIPIDHVSTHQLDTLLRLWVQDHAQRVIVTPNPEMLLAARKDPDFHYYLQASHLSLPDGVGLRYATAALTDQRLSFRHTGVDTLLHLARVCEDHGKRLVLLGSRQDVARRAASELRRTYPDLDVIGINPGDLVITEETVSVDPDVLEELQGLRPAVLAVAFGAGKQEQFIHQHLHVLPSVKIAIGIGGALDMLSGDLRRAPAWMRKAGLEWAWRVAREPSRAGRIWRAFVVFPSVVAYDSLRQRRFVKAVFRVVPEVGRQLTGN